MNKETIIRLNDSLDLKSKMIAIWKMAKRGSCMGDRRNQKLLRFLSCLRKGYRSCATLSAVEKYTIKYILEFEDKY